MNRATLKLPSVVTADRRQNELFAIVGRNNRPFANVGSFPSLENEIQKSSQTLLHELGRAAWKNQGGSFDKDGHPTFDLRCPTVGFIVRELAREYGGLDYADRDGHRWSVSLLAKPNSDAFFGIAISSHKMRIDKIRFGPHVEQMLWLLHTLIWQQRSSVVVLPDEWAGICRWGGEKKPANWRNVTFNLLCSLSDVRLEVLNLAGHGWTPRVGTHCVAIASVTRDSFGRGRRICQQSNCPCRNDERPHGHFTVEIGRGFLGVLENYARSECGHRSYDFFSTPTQQAEESIKQARRSGEIVQVSGQLKVLGGAKWCDASPQCRDILAGLLLELTRCRNKNGRPDKAMVCRYDKIPQKTSKDLATCPLLSSRNRWVICGGNGKRKGLGYQLVGKRGTGWLHKFGYEVGDMPTGRKKQIRELFRNVRWIQDTFDFVIASFEYSTRKWLCLNQMTDLLRSKTGRSRLKDLSVRFYAPENFLDRIRRFLERQGQLQIVDDAVATPAAVASQIDIATSLSFVMRQRNLRQEDLGQLLGCSQQFVSELVNGQCKMPLPMIARARNTFGNEFMMQ